MKLKNMLVQAGLKVTSWYKPADVLGKKELALAKKTATLLNNDPDTVIAFCIAMLEQADPKIASKVTPVLVDEYKEHFPMTW